MVPRLRHGATAARGMGGARLAAAQRSLQPASGQEVPGGCTLYDGEFQRISFISCIAYVHLNGK